MGPSLHKCCSNHTSRQALYRVDPAPKSQTARLRERNCFAVRSPIPSRQMIRLVRPYEDVKNEIMPCLHEGCLSSCTAEDGLTASLFRKYVFLPSGDLRLFRWPTDDSTTLMATN